MNDFEDAYGILALSAMEDLTREFDGFDLMDDENPLMTGCLESSLFEINQYPLTQKMLKITLVD